ncbi:MAG: alanine dehydrogenase, partial [Anaerolineales bacterium]
MDIGIPRERQPSEYRVGFPPAGVRQLANVGHRVYVESGAGEGAGFSDIDFESAGASIVYSGEEIYGRVELVMKIARPTQQEMVWIRSGQTLLG